jgi:uncharacterized lipoprotein YmbA
MIAFGGACLTVNGCSPLAPRPDPSKYFLLAPVTGSAPPSQIRSALSPGLTIGVGPIDFPDYLRRPDVVTRTSPTQIDISNENVWGEPLDKNFERVLRENLSRLLNTQRIEKYPWSRKTEVDYQIEIDVQRFETSSDGQSQLVARWIIKDGRSGKDLYASETRAVTAVGAGDTVASAALSNDLATLSQDIASRVASLSQQRAS